MHTKLAAHARALQQLITILLCNNEPTICCFATHSRVICPKGVCHQLEVVLLRHACARTPAAP